jgi:hypothetical protein
MNYSLCPDRQTGLISIEANGHATPAEAVRLGLALIQMGLGNGAIISDTPKG